MKRQWDDSDAEWTKPHSPPNKIGTLAEEPNRAASPLSSTSTSTSSSPSQICAIGNKSMCCDGCIPGFSKRDATVDSTASLTHGEQVTADDFKSLSLMERERVYEDVHGVSPQIEETPEMVAARLQELDAYIKSARRKDVYDRAQFLSPRYVKDEQRRLQFLRSTEWDVPAAANKIFKYFKTKLILFGEEKLVAPIVLSDLPPDAHESLKNGAQQMYETTADRSGRVIIFDVYANWRYRSVKSHVQALWYLNENITYSPEQQRRGIVVVAMTIHAMRTKFYEGAGVAKWDILNIMPIRFAGVHFFFEDVRVRPIFSVLQAAMPKALRLRTKTHFGSTMECIYELAAYGIRPEDLPFDVNGQSKEDAIRQHMEECMMRDDANLRAKDPSQPEDCIQRPGPNDIVLGRGWPYQSYMGNVKLTEIVATYQERHLNAANRTQKTKITHEVVQIIRANGGRFLKRDPSGDWWMEVSDTAAREKVAMTFRNKSRRAKPRAG